jgi:prefoldin beta subunit
MSIEQTSLQYSEAQEALQSSLSGRQQLETQLQENKIVLDEFLLLKNDAKVYKLTGPVLLPQDLEEAKVNVEKRIEFITKEMYVLMNPLCGASLVSCP